MVLGAEVWGLCGPGHFTESHHFVKQRRPHTSLHGKGSGRLTCRPGSAATPMLSTHTHRQPGVNRSSHCTYREPKAKVSGQPTQVSPILTATPTQNTALASAWIDGAEGRVWCLYPLAAIWTRNNENLAPRRKLKLKRRVKKAAAARAGSCGPGHRPACSFSSLRKALRVTLTVTGALRAVWRLGTLGGQLGRDSHPQCQ